MAITPMRRLEASRSLPGQVSLLGSRTLSDGRRVGTPINSAGVPTVAKSLSRIRSRALQLQGGRCFYCSVLMWTDDCAAFANRHRLPPRLAKWLQCTAEHLQARQEGGRDSIKNIAAACRVCNHRRHAQRRIAPTPEEYRALVRKRVSKKAWHPPQVFERGLIGGG